MHAAEPNRSAGWWSADVLHDIGMPGSALAADRHGVPETLPYSNRSRSSVDIELAVDRGGVVHDRFRTHCELTSDVLVRATCCHQPDHFDLTRSEWSICWAGHLVVPGPLPVRGAASVERGLCPPNRFVAVRVRWHRADEGEDLRRRILVSGPEDRGTDRGRQPACATVVAVCGQVADSGERRLDRVEGSTIGRAWKSFRPELHDSSTYYTKSRP